MGLVPTDARIGNGNSVVELGRIAVDLLTPRVDIAFEHSADDSGVSANPLIDDALERHVHLGIILVAVSMAAVDEDLHGHAAFPKLPLGGSDRRGVEVRSPIRPAQDEMSVWVASSVYDRRVSGPIDAEESVPRTRRDHRIDGDLRTAVRSILEPNGHTQAAGHLPVRLTLGRARANRNPTDEVGQVLRYDGIEELRRSRHPHLRDIQQQIPALLQAGRDVERIIHVRIVQQPLPANSGSRLFEVHAHGDEHSVLVASS